MNYSLDSQPLVPVGIPVPRKCHRFRLFFNIDEAIVYPPLDQIRSNCEILAVSTESVEYQSGFLKITFRIPQNLSIDEIQNLFQRQIAKYSLEILNADGTVAEILEFIKSSVDTGINFDIKFDYAQDLPLRMTVKLAASMSAKQTDNQTTPQLYFDNSQVSTVSDIVT